MRNAFKSALLGAVLFIPSMLALSADAPRAYAFGPVVNVSYIKVKPGGFDKYLAYLAGPYKKLMEEYKKAGLILTYNVYQAEARNPGDPDLILTITYKNWAALDNLADKTDPLDAKVFGSMDAATKGTVDSGVLREQLGAQTVQELILK